MPCRISWYVNAIVLSWRPTLRPENARHALDQASPPLTADDEEGGNPQAQYKDFADSGVMFDRSHKPPAASHDVRSYMLLSCVHLDCVLVHAAVAQAEECDHPEGEL